MIEQNKDLDTLLSKDELLTLPEVADELGIAVTRVHDLLHDKKLIAHTLDGVKYVPALFINDKGAINKYVSGAITVLSDGGFSNEEILEYFFTEDESLPGRPIDGLQGHLAREVIRRAQAMGL
ncbi:Rv2175c family DNA-binding protein [Corynebacteriaceae bacterium 6-324]